MPSYAPPPHTHPAARRAVACCSCRFAGPHTGTWYPVYSTVRLIRALAKVEHGGDLFVLYYCRVLCVLVSQEMGIDWSIREGYAWVEDKEHCEEYGRMLQADPTKVR